MKRTGKIDVSEWIKFGEADLRFASWGMKDNQPAFHSICFLCQASAEKYLKALLLKNGWELKRTHDMVFLLNKLKTECGCNVENMIEPVTYLNSFVENARYPGDVSIEYFSKEIAEKAIKSALEVQTFACEKLV